MSHAPSRPIALIVGTSQWLPQLLAGAGYDVSSTSSGFEARELGTRAVPDLIIVSPVAEDMSGTEVCRLLRTDPAIPRHVPIFILFDGPPTPELRVAALRVGAWDFLSPSVGREEILLKLAGCLDAQRSVAEAVDEGLLDPASGFYSQPGLARRARTMAALMSRVRGPFACVVIEFSGRVGLHELGGVVARAARISDVVGDLGSSRIAILAPGTDAAGAIRLAVRIAEAVRAVLAQRDGAPLLVGDAWSHSAEIEISAGFDVVANAKYTPIEPFALLRRTVDAIHHGEPDRTHRWVRRSIDHGHPTPADPLGVPSPFAL
jgi:CheY-like chemotaxis protein